MVDIARVFSPVVVFPSSEARPQSSDRIRSASAKRVSSASTHRTSCISSAVSTVESDGLHHGRYAQNETNDEKDKVDSRIKVTGDLFAELMDVLERKDIVSIYIALNHRLSSINIFKTNLFFFFIKDHQQ